MSAHSFRRKINLAGGGKLEALVPTAGTAPRRTLADGVALNGKNFAALFHRRATGTRACCEIKGGVPDSAVGGRAGCAVPPSRCQLPVRKVPGWRALGFPPGLWVAPKRFPGVVAGVEEAGEGGTPPCCPGVYGLLWLPPQLCLPL